MNLGRAVSALLIMALGTIAPPTPVWAQSQVDAPAARMAVRQAIEGYIRPGYDTLHAQAGTMAAAMVDLCATPSDRLLAEARAGFARLVTAWSAVEFIRFGPVIDENRLERVLFWPDRRGIALRQIRAILAESDESAAQEAQLSGKSVAVQGLNALEFILFGSDAEALGDGSEPFRCRYGRAVAGNVRSIAAAVLAEWSRDDGIAARLLSPSADDPAYRSDSDALQAIIGIQIFGSEAMRDLRLGPAVGESAADARPNAWIYRRSGLTRASLEANFDGLRHAFDASGIAGLLAPQTDYIAGSIAFEFGNARRTLDEIRAPLPEAVLSPEDHGRLSYLVIVTRSLQEIFADRLSPALGLSTGFSALDGD